MDRLIGYNRLFYDMVIYEKDGKEFLVNSSSYGNMRILDLYNRQYIKDLMPKKYGIHFSL